MAATVSAIIECNASGSDTNSGWFDPGVSGFPLDGSASAATSASPVFSSASYNFVAGDVGHWIYIKSGTSSIPGWYKIVSVASNQATLNATIGQAVKSTGVLSTATGCGSATPISSLTWGIDYSQSTSAQITFTDMVIDGSTNTKFTSVANPVGKNFVGNSINITSGTGFTVQRAIVVSTVTTTATCDKSLGTLSSTGGNGKLGGAVATDVTAYSFQANSNRIWIKGGAYSSATTPTIAVTGVVPDYNVEPNRVTGYVTYRGDASNSNKASWPVITATTGRASGLALGSVSGWLVENLVFDMNGATNSTANTDGISFAGAYTTIRNCWAKNFKRYGITMTVSGAVIGCEVSGGLTGATAGISTNNLGRIIFNCVHDNVCTGIIGSSNDNTVTHNLVYNNTGANSDGISIPYNSVAMYNTCDANGRDGIRFTYNIGQTIKNNLLTNNGAYGLRRANGSGDNDFMFDGNAYYNNTTAARLNCGTSILDITLSGDPFTNRAGAVFTLNKTAGAGYACRMVGYPGLFIDALNTTYSDMGAIAGKSITEFSGAA